MFYVLNNGNKKKLDPYKKVLKQLVDEVQEMDIEPLQQISEESNDKGIRKIEEFVLWVKKQNENVNYKEVEQKLKEFYLSQNSEEVFYCYLSILSSTLYEDFIIKGFRSQGVPLEQIFKDANEVNSRMKTKTIICLVCFYSMVLSNRLLDKKIDFIDVKENVDDTKIIRSVKSEPISILKGVNGMPLLVTKREAEWVTGFVGQLRNGPEAYKLKEYLQILFSHRILEDLMSIYCFGKDALKYIQRKEFTGSELLEMERSRSFIIPMELLYSRKLIPPVEGVVLKVNNHRCIESIYIKECTRFSFRVIHGVVRFRDGFEQPISMKMNYGPSLLLNCFEAPDVASIIVDFYNVPKDKIDELISLPKVSDYEVLSAHYWAYNTKGYETIKDRELSLSGKKFKREYPIKIATYVRNIKGNASQDARNLANKVKIHLGENQTLVKESNRNYDRVEG